MRTLAFVLTATTAVMCASFAQDQPASCTEDGQCHIGHFCETATNLCQKCLSCASLKRELPVLGSPNTCIKSVRKCGSCLQGLVVDHRGDADGACVPPGDLGADGTSSAYMLWSIIGFLILFFVIVIIITIYVMRRLDLFKISSATWLRSACASRNASAPADPPPPYNPYSAVRAESPIAMPDVTYTRHIEEESFDPFVKRVPTGPPAPSEREAAGNQNARVYDPPAYVRLPQGQTPIIKNEDSNEWPSIHNENTTPDEWTPNSSTNDANGNVSISEVVESPASTTSAAMSSDLPALLAAARETTLVSPPAKKMKTQDTNNNDNRGTASADFVGTSSANASEPAIYLNIVQINNTAKL